MDKKQIGEIRDILAEDAYNEGAFMFDDNKMRFCFTPEELESKAIKIYVLVQEQERELVQRFSKKFLGTATTERGVE